MRTALATRIESPPEGRVCVRTTLLDLVRAVSETTEDDAEVVSTVLHLLRAGHAELCGAFANEPIDSF